MSKINGRFYFKLTSNKNLLGEFSNQDGACQKNYTESAVRISKGNDAPFIGIYRSTWWEETSNAPALAELKIENRQDRDGAYRLEWRYIKGENAESKPYFTGEAMLCDGMLIGNYWSQ